MSDKKQEEKQKEKQELIKNYFSNLNVKLVTAAYTKCPVDWRDLDYTPDYSKFYYILDGEGWIKIGDKEYYPRAGQLFLMPSGIKQSYSTVNDNTFTKYWCHFKAVIGEINIFDIISIPYYINVSEASKITDIFKRLVLYYNNDDVTAALKSRAVLYELVSFYIEEASKQYIKMKDTAAVGKIFELIKYIDINLTSNISITDLAEIVHYHPNYFIRFFRKHFGTSPAQYINNKRMEKSKVLLETTGVTVSEIAYSTGFKDIYHFSRVFKSHTGFSPSEYRKMISGIL
jgi:AraC family transcriptional regulator, arabinose operon regulatory protein